MKNIKSRILLVFLANLILFNSFGFGLVEHSCSMRSKKTYSFIHKTSCQGCDIHKAPLNGKQSISRTKCCDEKESQKAETISELTVSFLSKILKVASEMVYKAVIWIATLLYQAVLSILGFNNSENSSFSGKNLLIFIGQFRL